MQVFDVQTGAPMKHTRFEYKLKQIEFNCGSTKFLLLHDEFKPNTPSMIKVYDFNTFFTKS